MAQFHFTPEHYLESMRAELPRYDELQQRVAEASAGGRVNRILELGIGTGETARRVLAEHHGARLVGVDESPPMLERARLTLPEDHIEELRVGRLQDSLPEGPFDLVVSALAVHHLDSAGKQDLFLRVRDVLQSDGRFVLADVVVPDRAKDAVTPLEEGFDLPDRLADQLAWLADAGLPAKVTWAWKDVAVVAAMRP